MQLSSKTIDEILFINEHRKVMAIWVVNFPTFFLKSKEIILCMPSHKNLDSILEIKVNWRFEKANKIKKSCSQSKSLKWKMS